MIGPWLTILIGFLAVVFWRPELDGISIVAFAIALTIIGAVLHLMYRFMQNQ